MRKTPTFKPGEIALESGQYEIVRNGRRTGIERTVVKDEPLPPTPRPGDEFVLVDKTKHGK